MGTREHVSPFGEGAGDVVYELILLLRAPRPDWVALVERALRKIVDAPFEDMEANPSLRLKDMQQKLASGVWHLHKSPDSVLLLGMTGATHIDSEPEPWVEDFDELGIEDGDELEAYVPAIRQLVESHRAYLSVRPGPPGLIQSPLETNRLHCRLAGELWGDDVIALFENETATLLPGIDETRDLLRSGALFELASEPVQYACEHCVAEAAEQAQACWFEFADTFSRRRKGHMFFVKHRLGPPSDSELVWSRVVGITGSRVTAKLESDPVDPEIGVRGDPQRIAVDAVLDWYYELPDLEMTGGWYSHPEMQSGEHPNEVEGEQEESG